VSQRLGHASTKVTLDRYSHTNTTTGQARLVATKGIRERTDHARRPFRGQVVRTGYFGLVPNYFRIFPLPRWLQSCKIVLASEGLALALITRLGEFIMRTLASILSAAALAGTVLLAPTAAMADTAGCATRAEFHHVHKGQSLAKVRRIMDTNGHQTYFYNGTYIPDSQSRDYRACYHPRWSSISVDFDRKGGVWKVTGKSAYWI